jgi:hypothetical protein
VRRAARLPLAPGDGAAGARALPPCVPPSGAAGAPALELWLQNPAPAALGPCRIDAQVALLGKEPKAAAAALLPDLQQLVTSFEAHLRSEEDHMQPIGRRYLPLAVHKQITAKVWAWGSRAWVQPVGAAAVGLAHALASRMAALPAPRALLAALDAAWVLAALAPARAPRR